MGKVIEMGSVSPAEGSRDVLTEILRTGARRLLSEALEVEVEEFVEQYRELKDEQGRQRVVRNGYLPERTVQTGIGSIPVRVPRARDRGSADAVRFRSSILPPYLRRSSSCVADSRDLRPRGPFLRGSPVID